MVLTGADRVDMKVVLLGKEYGGKTSLAERYLRNHFNGHVPYTNTIGAAYGARRLEINGREIVLGIWDTAGSERYESMSRIYYRGAKAAVICYDLTDRTSYDRALQWAEEIGELEPGCSIYFCGTKKDLVAGPLKQQRQVDYHNAREYAETIHAKMIETSSKTGENISELFTMIAEDFANEPENFEPPEDPNKFRLQSEVNKSSGCQLRYCSLL